MTAFVIVVCLLMVWRATACLRRRHRPSWTRLLLWPPLRRRPARRRRLGDRKRRREAAEAARDLVAMLATAEGDPVAHLSIGVVLQPGEMPLACARARLVTLETHVTQVSARRVRWLGHRVEGAVEAVSASGWQDHRESDWVITSLRLVARARPDGELLSIWWSGIAGLQVDLDADTVRLDGNNGWRGAITGPGVAPIAVAGVAACHGPDVLASHPALACLRPRRVQAEKSAVPEPPALGPGDPMAERWPR